MRFNVDSKKKKKNVCNKTVWLHNVRRRGGCRCFGFLPLFGVKSWLGQLTLTSPGLRLLAGSEANVQIGIPEHNFGRSAFFSQPRLFPYTLPNGSKSLIKTPRNYKRLRGGGPFETLLVLLTQINDVCLRALPSNVRLFFLFFFLNNKVRTFQGDSRADTPVKPSGGGPDSVPWRALKFQRYLSPSAMPHWLASSELAPCVFAR